MLPNILPQINPKGDPRRVNEVNKDVPPNGDGMRVLCVFEEKTSITFVNFDEVSGTMSLETSACFGHDTKDTIESFMASIETPNLILVSQKIASNGPLLELLVSATSNPGSGAGSPPPTASTVSLNEKEMIPYKVLKNCNFDQGTSINLITTKLKVKAMEKGLKAAAISNNAVSFPPPLDPTSAVTPSYKIEMAGAGGGNYHALATLIDFNSSTEVRAVGGLMTYLQSTVFRLTENNVIEVNRIVSSPPSSYMRVTPLALRSLHIFNEEHHPLIAKGTGGSKEGFSLFSLLDRCSSKLGSRCMRQWMLRPLTNLKEIGLRQSGIELLMKSELGGIIQQLSIFFHKFADVPIVISRMQKCQTRPLDFVSLKISVDAAIQIHGLLCGDIKRAGETSHHKFITHITKLINQRCLIEISRKIEAAIDLELTRQTKEICINDGFSPDLDNAKLRFDELDDLLSRVGVSVAQRAPQLGPLQVIFLPQVGFLVTVQKTTAPTSFVPPQDFSFTFEEAETIYFKCEEMYVLDDQEGDLDALIKDTEAFLAAELEEEIIEHDLAIRNTFRGLSELDCILSLAAAAAELNFVKPEVVDDENIILIENGRSALQEIVTEHKYIPNDTAMTKESPIAVITGPNYSGKSCYLSQVGVLQFLAQIGSYVPASRAKIGVVDQILVRINSIETCSTPQSAFQIDLTQMGGILKRATKRSLVLMDEFGKGTSPASGIALLGAAIEELSTKGCRVICTTHLLELFSFAILQEGKGGVALYKMSIHIPEDAKEDAVPLFKLQKGVASSSDGLLCAKMAGLRPDVLERGEELLEAVTKGSSITRLEDTSDLGNETRNMLISFLKEENWGTRGVEELEVFLELVKEAVC